VDQWTYNILVVDMTGAVANKPSITRMWEVRGPDGLTDWDRLQNMGRDGWELVTVLPVAAGQGSTAQVVFTFKKRVKVGA
jgi:hypothetical protein